MIVIIDRILNPSVDGLSFSISRRERLQRQNTGSHSLCIFFAWSSISEELRHCNTFCGYTRHKCRDLDAGTRPSNLFSRLRASLFPRSWDTRGRRATRNSSSSSPIGAAGGPADTHRQQKPSINSPPFTGVLGMEIKGLSM